MSFGKVPNFLVNLFKAEMDGNETLSYVFKSFLLNVAERQLSRGDEPISITPKAFDVLSYLVAHSGHLVLKEDLMKAVWPDSFVDEVNIPRTIHTIRRALGEDENGNKFIETIPTKGYRFIADVKGVGGNGSGSQLIAPAIHNEEPAVAAKNGGAYQLPYTSESKDGVHEAEVRRRALRGFAFFAAPVVLVIASVAGFFLFGGYGPIKSAVKNVTPETFSGEALQNYTQGRFLIERRHDGDYAKALEMFEKAIELDPNYANAYAGKADVKVVQFWGSNKHEDISPARTAALKAIELDPSNSYAHAVFCRILTTYDWNHSEAEKECRKAVELDPNDHEAQKELAFFLRSLGRESEALEAIDKAVAIAPTSFNKRSRGLILYQTRRYDDAIAQLEQVEQTDPLYKESTRWLIRAHEMKKDYPRALQSYMSLIAHFGARPEEIGAVKAVFEQDGWPGVLRTMIDSPTMRTLFKAGTLAQLGEIDRAFETLDEMFKRRAILLITIAQEPTLEPLHGDPRFDDLLKSIGLKTLRSK